MMFNLGGMVSRSKQMKKDRQMRLNRLNEMVLLSKETDSKLKVSDLKGKIGVSETTLQKYFYDLGYTPVKDYAEGWKN